MPEKNSEHLKQLEIMNFILLAAPFVLFVGAATLVMILKILSITSAKSEVFSSGVLVIPFVLAPLLVVGWVLILLVTIGMGFADRSFANIALSTSIGVMAWYFYSIKEGSVDIIFSVIYAVLLILSVYLPVRRRRLSS